MAKRNEPVVKVWGLQELDNSRLKQLDFGQRLGDGLWAYPVFTTREAALKFADMLTEDAGGRMQGCFVGERASAYAR